MMPDVSRGILPTKIRASQSLFDCTIVWVDKSIGSIVSNLPVKKRSRQLVEEDKAEISVTYEHGKTMCQSHYESI